MNYYNEISEGYEELHKEEQLKKIEIIKKFLSPKPSDKLLDVGCGTGLTAECWKCRRFGIDASEKLIAKAKAKDTKREINYRVASAENIPFPDKYFDYVVSITAIQNFDDIEKGLKEIKRVAKEKGKIVLSFLKKSNKKDLIENLIKKIFKIEKEIEEEKDIIYFLII